MANGNGSGNGRRPTKRTQPKKPKRTRPSVLTQQVIIDYLAARRRGGSDTDCAYMAGIHPDTVRRWRYRLEACDPQVDDDTGKLGTYADDGALPTIPEIFEFFERVKKATAEARIERLAHIEQAGIDGTWTAAAWWLERRYPDEYGRRDRRDVTVRTGALEASEFDGSVDGKDDEKLNGIRAALIEAGIFVEGADDDD